MIHSTVIRVFENTYLTKEDKVRLKKKMKMYVFLSLLAYALAEPPVGDSYASARSNHNHGIDNQRSLSQEYGAPAFGARNQNYPSIDARSQHPVYDTSFRSTPSQEYGIPASRSGLSQEYGQPNFRTGPSQTYGLPNSRSLSQQYGPPSSRNAASEYNPLAVRSQDFGANNARFSQEYGTPQLRSGSIPDYNTDISDSYGAPLQRSSSPHGRSGFRPTPSQEYGIPSQRNFDQFPSEKNSQPNFRNTQSFSPISRGNSARTGFSSKTSSAFTRDFQSSLGSQSQNYGSSRSALSQHAVPDARNFDSYSPASISASYLPSSRTVSQTYGSPESRGLSSEHGLSEGRSGINTNAFASSFDSARSKYGAPSGREAMPSEQYGLPEQYEALSSQGYSYARNALDELLNQEPANYDFGYKVNDYITGSDFGHTETRQENKAEGSYFVVLPDGTKQVVEYEADERGFKPRISVEPAETRLGYDDNAADLVRSGDGPY